MKKLSVIDDNMNEDLFTGEDVIEDESPVKSEDVIFNISVKD